MTATKHLAFTKVPYYVIIPLMAKKPRNLPLRESLGPQIGDGQDNAVYRLLDAAPKPHLRTPTGWVTKIGHDFDRRRDTTDRPRHSDALEAARRGIHYKKNKYDILKHFLGDYIPESTFILTKATESGGRERYVEMTMQREVPQVTLGKLTPEQRGDPRLHTSMKELVGRMQYMYSVLGEVNARSANGINLDAKMDLGGISDRVRAERLDHRFTDEETDRIIESTNSPNLLVDPETMQLYCVDFDQGQWVEGMDDAKRMAFEIDARNAREHKQAPYVGATAVQ